ncbi:MAG: molybdopterin molybdotransferase MoeA [Syntrophomonadaceae bacterium]|nr:molybdopterin molybdotransferase MoeA [Syntrophomonadaceae bacterium]
MAEFFNVLSLPEATRIIADNWPRPAVKTVGLEEALGRTLAADVIAGEDLPQFPRSTVDGYAVLASDVHGASETIPAFLSLVGEVVIGLPPRIDIASGQCAWIPTGGMLPTGADAVVMVEHTEALDRETVLVTRQVAPGENVIRAGEDCRVGEQVLPEGHTLRPQDIGVLAALGITEIPVFSPMRCGVISTGDEVVGIDATPAMGQVRDVNSYVLGAALKRRGVDTRYYGVAADDFNRLQEKIAAALAENDLVVISGGSSVGNRDLSLEVLLSFPDSRLLFHGLSIKPGKPTLAVRKGPQLVLGLPGHPVSALMVLEVLLEAVLPEGLRGTCTAVLTDNVASQAGRDDFVRVKVEHSGEVARAIPVHGKPGLIRVMSEANGFIHIPHHKQGLRKGETVIVRLF